MLTRAPLTDFARARRRVLCRFGRSTPGCFTPEPSRRRAPRVTRARARAMSFDLRCAVLCYALAGVAHELAHVLAHAALALAKRRGSVAVFDACAALDARASPSSLAATLARALGRRSAFADALDDASCANARAIVRWAGALASLGAAAAATTRTRGDKSGTSAALRVACWATVLDAVCTDVLDALPRARGTVLCGNFGIILINAAWCESERGKRAFDLLEKMVYVTMMRGAQSGGVVTFDECREKARGEGAAVALRGARSRVVNMKRTDLSKLVRAKAERDCGGAKMGRQNVTRMIVGHTRFATTSKATFDGTHPHQWSPPQQCLVYGQKQKTPGPTRVGVENYITHNGDFDFYQINKNWYELGEMQRWLEIATGHPMPSVVDSAAIAGVIDLLRAQGSFALAARFAVCVGLNTSDASKDAPVPTLAKFEEIARYFENALDASLSAGKHTVRELGFQASTRELLTEKVVSALEGEGKAAIECINYYIDEEMGSSLRHFVRSTIDAFFDNDSLFVTKTFLANAKGSFGLMVTNSLDAHRQLCVAARGQTISIAFYPKKGLICYGSEQAAVKAGLSIPTPGGDVLASVHGGEFGDDNAAVRLDLDDLNGEICLLDWEDGDEPAVSFPNSHLEQYPLMGGKVTVVLAAEGTSGVSKSTIGTPAQSLVMRKPSLHVGVSVDKKLFRRMTRLEGNDLIKPLLPDREDLVLHDIHDIPKILRNIQEDWQNRPQATISLNRLTAWNLARCLRRRLDRRLNSTTKSSRSIDVVVTGCEVSLWLAEQFAADLQQAFPRLTVKAVSSNKILGLFGQDIPIPTVGFPDSKKNDDFTDSVVIVVSHSGGTFAPLATSNLLVSSTSSIFVVASEWDTQIGKQLRAIKSDGAFCSRIFSTDVGVRPAEPCSVSVAATQQLLTQIFMHMSLVILGNADYRKYAGAVVTKHDLAELERCNQMNITALEEIVGVKATGEKVDSSTERSLRAQGDEWSDHVLEGVKGWMMSFAYIVGTVTAGYPLITGVAAACGLAATWAFYLTRFFDALIYVFLPQINITIIRLVQGRNLRHRMTGRTVVIGDVPWVAQAADAFLSKIFACSYSAAGLNVLSGNPNDHLVHRHTHRVVRGALLVVGRPDGRLAALTSAEATTSLSLAQASSIQSYGGTCESITIGHSPYKLPLSKNGIFLKRHRPMYLCEKLVLEREGEKSLDGRSPGSLLGVYNKYHEEGAELSVHSLSRRNAVQVLTASRIKAARQKGNLRSVFDEIDVNRDGTLCLAEFTQAYKKVDESLTDAQIAKLFRDADVDNSGTLDYDEFCEVMNLPEMDMLNILEADARNEEGLLMVEPSHEDYFGQSIRRSAPKKIKAYTLVESQEFSMSLYESRIASLQRFVSMTVMFHQMGDRAQKFWRNVSFGYLGYRMDRTHSIMRIATTASPVSGAEVRDRRHFIALVTAFNNALGVIDNSGHILLSRRRTESYRLTSRQNSAARLSRQSSVASATGA